MKRNRYRFAPVALLLLSFLFIAYPLSASPVLLLGGKAYGRELPGGFVRAYETIYWPFMHAPGPIQDAFGSWVDLWLGDD
jgi:hypothetical protein